MIKYYVDKNAGVVVARLVNNGGEEERDYWRWSLLEMLDNIFLDTNIGAPYDYVDDVLDSMPNLSAKAKCCPVDTFDEEFGKKLAKQRLLEKWYRVKDRVLKLTWNSLDKDVEYVKERLFDKYCRA